MTRHEILQEIKDHPDRHKHRDMNGLMSCAMIGGAIDLSVMAAHEGLHGHNGGVACDVATGPCSCGAFH